MERYSNQKGARVLRFHRRHAATAPAGVIERLLKALPAADVALIVAAEQRLRERRAALGIGSPCGSAPV